MSLRWTVLAVLLIPAAAAADRFHPHVEDPLVASRAGDAEGFVPAGWRLEQRHVGDLGGDGRDDLVLLLEMDDPGNRVRNEALGPPVFDTNPRMLVAAFAERPGGYRRVLAGMC